MKTGKVWRDFQFGWQAEHAGQANSAPLHQGSMQPRQNILNHVDGIWPNSTVENSPGYTDKEVSE